LRYIKNSHSRALFGVNGNVLSTSSYGINAAFRPFKFPSNINVFTKPVDRPRLVRLAFPDGRAACEKEQDNGSDRL
jgi:hypothetical protein